MFAIIIPILNFNTNKIINIIHSLNKLSKIQIKMAPNKKEVDPKRIICHGELVSTSYPQVSIHTATFF